MVYFNHLPSSHWSQTLPNDNLDLYNHFSGKNSFLNFLDLGTFSQIVAHIVYIYRETCCTWAHTWRWILFRMGVIKGFYGIPRLRLSFCLWWCSRYGIAPCVTSCCICSAPRVGPRKGSSCTPVVWMVVTTRQSPSGHGMLPPPLAPPPSPCP